MSRTIKRKAPKPKGLRIQYYPDVTTDTNETINCFADQYGRVMMQFLNSDRLWDIKPTGQAIYARH